MVNAEIKKERGGSTGGLRKGRDRRKKNGRKREGGEPSNKARARYRAEEEKPNAQGESEAIGLLMGTKKERVKE